MCFDELFKSEMTVSGLSKKKEKKMVEMLSLFLKESIILFDNKYYRLKSCLTQKLPARFQTSLLQ